MALSAVPSVVAVISPVTLKVPENAPAPTTSSETDGVAVPIPILSFVVSTLKIGVPPLASWIWKPVVESVSFWNNACPAFSPPLIFNPLLNDALP